MLRLKTTTKLGKVFLSPFVYNIRSQKQIDRKLAELDWQIPKYKSGYKKGEPIGKASMELIEVTKFPKNAVYHFGLELIPISLLLRKVKILENRWEDLWAQQLLREH